MPVDFTELSDSALLELVAEWSISVNRVTLARETAPGEAARAVARWVAGVDPDGTLDAAADVRRRLTMAAGLDGRVHLRGELDPVALARGALGTGRLPDVRGERAHVRVTIDSQSLCAARGTVGMAGGQLEWPVRSRRRPRVGWPAIPPWRGSSPAPTLCPSMSDGPSAPRTPRSAGPWSCATGTACSPGATRYWSGATSNHMIHWAFGGATSCDNGALLCERHHTSCHEGGFSVRRDPGTSRWHTHRPDGTEILRPRRPLSGPG